eukprot:m.159726 g.159726  ORF g.159726 m.159726 type:complete len:544 (+) comp31152_c0_seq2:208-1839(+)
MKGFQSTCAVYVLLLVITPQVFGVILDDHDDATRVWRDHATAPDMFGTQSRCKQGSRECKDPSDRDSCSLVLGDCQLLYPIPDEANKISLEELPRFESCCFEQFNDASPDVVTNVPAPKWGQMQRLLAFVGTNADDCQSSCFANEDCVTWTHRAPETTPGPDDLVSDDNTCILYSTSVEHARMIVKKANTKRCTSGFVRPGRARITGPFEDDNEKRQEVKALGDVDIASVGQCLGSNCIDVHHCASRVSRESLKGKIAFVFTDDLRRSPTVGVTRKIRNLGNSTAQRRRLLAAKEHDADLVVIVPDDHMTEFPLTQLELDYFGEVGMVVVKVPWMIPPGVTGFDMKCGHMDLIRLNAFRLTQYKAVVVIDTDVTIIGDVTPLFQCAAQNKIITASGNLSPLNLGVIALQPSDATFRAIEMFGSHVSYNKTTGWDNAGHAPMRSDYIGSGCGQGYYWTLFYQNGERIETSRAMELAWKAAGSARPHAFQADRCIWNYQGEHSGRCNKDFECSDVRVIHKRIKVEAAKDPQRGNGCFYHYLAPKK